MTCFRPAVGVLAAVLASSSLPICAGGLEDLRAALDGLGPARPVRARVELRVTETENGRPKGPPRAGAFVVAHGPEGLRIERDPGGPGEVPGGKAHERPSLTSEEAFALVDAASDLRRRLDGATLLSDAVETRDGAPVRVVTLRPKPKSDEKSRESPKQWDETLAVTLDARGVPVASAYALSVKATVFLFWTATASIRETKRYEAAAGRLVVRSSDQETSGAALGQKGDARTEISVTPL